jgi:hypothetical protein
VFYLGLCVWLGEHAYDNRGQPQQFVLSYTSDIPDCQRNTFVLDGLHVESGDVVVFVRWCVCVCVCVCVTHLRTFHTRISLFRRPGVRIWADTRCALSGSDYCND